MPKRRSTPAAAVAGAPHLPAGVGRVDLAGWAAARAWADRLWAAVEGRVHLGRRQHADRQPPDPRQRRPVSILVHPQCHRLLARDFDHPLVRMAPLGPASARLPPDQPRPASGRGAAAVVGAPPPAGARGLAGGPALRGPSAQCGIGHLDRRAEESAGHAVLSPVRPLVPARPGPGPPRTRRTAGAFPPLVRAQPVRLRPGDAQQGLGRDAAAGPGGDCRLAPPLDPDRSPPAGALLCGRGGAGGGRRVVPAAWHAGSHPLGRIFGAPPGGRRRGLVLSLQGALAGPPDLCLPPMADRAGRLALVAAAAGSPRRDCPALAAGAAGKPPAARAGPGPAERAPPGAAGRSTPGFTSAFRSGPCSASRTSIS